MATSSKKVNLTAELVEAFAGAFLSPHYDNPAPVPAFHRECWGIYCDVSIGNAAVAAPRGHAKSTALTHNFGLAAGLFRVADYVVIVSATEELAIGHLGDIAKELRENEDLRAQFKIVSMPTDAKTDVVVKFEDGHELRYIAKGSGQKMRGIKWNGKRPGLIICDDLEEDEQVENADSRRKFRKWFGRALMPCLRKNGMIRMHGTIMHEDSLLARIMKSGSWVTRLYKAHRSFNDFSEILWPGQYTEEDLRKKRQGFIDDGDAPGYSQEYINDPYDNSQAYLRKDDFLPMRDSDHEVAKVIHVGADFAVSKQDKANRTSFTVGGKDTRNLIHVVDQYVGRWEPIEWIQIMIDIQRKWDPEEFTVEGGVIWKAIEKIIYNEMREQDVFLNIRVINPVSDKAVRGRAFQKRHRAGSMRYDKGADWYPEYEQELLRFTGISDALQDDQFDSTAILAKGFEETAVEVDEEDFYGEDDWEMVRNSPKKDSGRSHVTGY